MNTTGKAIIVIIMLAITSVLAFDIPKHKYEGTNILTLIKLPLTAPGWNVDDISDEINLNDKKLNFLGHYLAREYDKDLGPLLYLFILDGDNFHYPKTCVGGAGFDAQDLPDIEFKIPGHVWKAKAIYFQKNDEGFLTVYWICIDQKQVDWTGQKFTQLLYSMFNKKKTSLMVRIDITATKDQITQAGQGIQELLTTLSTQIPPEQQDYLFGK